MPLVIGEVHTALLMTSAAVSDEMATELLAVLPGSAFGRGSVRSAARGHPRCLLGWTASRPTQRRGGPAGRDRRRRYTDWDSSPSA
jgi:hypothetical protein